LGWLHKLKTDPHRAPHFYASSLPLARPADSLKKETHPAMESLLSSHTAPFRFTTRFAFEHISNLDGTSRSVCRRCRSVVATSHYEFPLEMAEGTHICSQLLLPAANSPRRIAAPHS
jgi:hypothetical protein